MRSPATPTPSDPAAAREPNRQPRTNLRWALGLAALIELVTVVFRFVLGMQSTRDTSVLAPFTFGYRIHHGYIGLAMMALARLWPSSPARSWLTRIGGAMVISDLAHHFLVLWPVTGDPQWDIRYGTD